MTAAAMSSPTLTTARARLFKVLADPTRLAVLQLLAEREHTVSELVDALGAPQSRVSNHLACLRWCEFVEAHRRGRHVVYRLRDQRLRMLLDAAAELAEEQAEQLSSCRRIGPDWI